MTFDEDDDHSYVPSPHVEALFASGSDEEAIVRAFIADIFAQRIRSHHAGAMEGPRFREHIERFIERAPSIIEVIIIKDGDENFSVQQVQRITDDLVELEDREFDRRYGLEELFAALIEAEAAGEFDRETPYQALARHLRPDDPTAGAGDIDMLILCIKRSRSIQHNRQRIAALAGPFLVGIGLASLGLPALFGAIDPATPFPLPRLPLVAAVATWAIGGALIWLSFRWLDDADDPPLPTTVAQWLTDNGPGYGLYYWDEVYWPTAKRLACERTVLGFSFWKKVPPPESEWPVLKAYGDSEWDYWEHGAGKPMSERYHQSFMNRIERWDAWSTRVLIACFAIVGVGGLADTGWAIFARDHHGLMTNPTSKIAYILVVMMLVFTLSHGQLPPLRWLPRPFRRRWFGPLPADAEAYRDFLLSRT